MRCFSVWGIVLAALIAAGLIFGGCGSSGTSSPDGAGIYQINMTGGDSQTGTAGFGGDLFLEKSAGQGNVELLSAGVADPGFTPETLTPSMASSDWTASVGSTLIKLAGDSYTPTFIDPPYLIATDSKLYVPNHTAELTDDLSVSGIYIPEGATVTLEANGTALLFEPTAQITVPDDFYLAGTLKTVDVPGTQKVHLNLLCDNFYSTGIIDTAGVSDVKDGGSVEIVANSNTLNQGTITSSGASSLTADGGHAGYISLETERDNVNAGRVENTGILTAIGGDGAPGALGVGNGGNGGDIFFWSYLDVRNSADIDARGGIGDDGGLGGALDVITSSGGFFSGGGLNLSGGESEAIGAFTGGGDGGDMAVTVEGGSITIAGTIDASGADGLLPGADAGNGGLLDLFSYPSVVIPVGASATRPTGSITVSGDIDLSGGDSDSGLAGFAGVLTVKAYVHLDAPGDEQGDNSKATVSFLGYKIVDLSGGNSLSGGMGGNVLLSHEINLDVPSSGTLVNEVDLNAVGGTGILLGGGGGDVVIDSMTSARNSADIVTDGGDAELIGEVTVGGNGGNITVAALNGFSNNGFLSYFGGTGDTPGSDGILTLLP